jgi:hypothetical protein
VEEAEAMKTAVSPSTGRRYPLTMVCGAFRVPRSSVYAARALCRTQGPPLPAAKRGPKTTTTDGEIVDAIRTVLAASPFHGEG